MAEKQPDLTHEYLADNFDQVMNFYDLEQRLKVLIDIFLSKINLENAWVLDAGCGTGHASKRLEKLAFKVISVDLGHQLLRLTQKKANTIPAQASILHLPFQDNQFDLVFSSEVIEHTPQPLLAVQELWRVIKPGGWLTLSTPNKLWEFPVRLSSTLRLRPYDGYENFLRPAELKRFITNLGGKVIQHRGIHLLPFQIPLLNIINRQMDKHGTTLLPVMINQAILCQKS
jgi:2-polyprenyl-6-hydroxyphenyl methylase/3-demethylubiquinone-9 3-methyltransferase